MFKQENNRLMYHYDAEKLWLEAWEVNSLRIRATKQSSMSCNNWTLQEQKSIQPEIITIKKE